MSDSAWPAWAIVAPLVGALASWLVGRRGAVVAIGSAAATVGVVIALALDVDARGVVQHRLGGWGAPLGVELRVDGAAALLLLVFGVVTALTTASAIGHFPAGRRRSAFVTLWLIAWAGLNALLLSADLFNLYVTLELLTLATVGAISLGPSRASVRAALQYLFVAILGALGYLLGVALVYGASSTLDVGLVGARLADGPIFTAAFALIVVGLSLKSALFPLHAWLPPAYAAAPAPVSALLSGVLGKAAFVVLLRVSDEALPFVPGAAPGQILGAQAAAAIVWCSILALRQRRLKMLIAYSSLAQTGYLFLAFPIGTPLARAGALYIAISHATASAAMFTAAGALERAAGTDSIDALSGVAQRNPLTFFALAIGGVNVMGLPPTGGFIAKWLLLRAAVESGQWWWAIVVLLGGLIAAAYVFRVLREAFVPTPLSTTAETPELAELVSILLAAGSLLLGVAPGWPLALAVRSAGEGP